MKTAIKTNHSAILAGAAAALAVAAMGFTGAAQARDNVYWSVGVGTPGTVLNVGNVGSVYQQPYPAYAYPRPVYVQPAPVYYEPRPLYVRPAPVYVAPQPIYYDRPRGHYGHGHGYGHGRRHFEGQYMQAPQHGYGYGYAPVYHQREGRHDYRY